MVYQTIGAIMRDLENIKRETSEPGDNPSQFIFTTGTLKTRVTQDLLEDRTMGTAFVLGHPTKGILGTSTLGAGTMSSWTSVASQNIDQTLTNIGLDEIRDWLATESAYYPVSMAVGSGSTAFTADDTALSSPINISTATQEISVSTGADYMEFSSTWTSVDATGVNYREFALLNQSEDMFSRIVLADNYSHTNAKDVRYTKRFSFTNAIPFMNAGTREIRDWLNGGIGNYPTYIAWGSGSINISANNTAIETETQRNAITRYDTSLDKIAMFESVLGVSEASGNNINRIGLFNASSIGDIFIYDSPPNIEKTVTFNVLTQCFIRLN